MAVPKPARGPLAELAAYLAYPGAPGEDPDAIAAQARRDAYPDMPVLDGLREIWSGLSADRQVRQSQEQVHKNAGPLNSNQLVHRALSLMRELSPGYLQQFVTYTEALVQGLEVMDATALSMCRDNDVTMVVFGLEAHGNVTRALEGEKIGTLVTAH